MRISSGCSHRSCKRNIDRAKRTPVEAGSTIQIDSYSAMHLFPIFLSLSPLFLDRISCLLVLYPSSSSDDALHLLLCTVRYTFTVSPFPLHLHTLSLTPSPPFSVSILLPRRGGGRRNKAVRLWCSTQPRWSISIYSTHSLSTVRACRFADSGLPAMQRAEIPTEFSRNAECGVCQWTRERSGTRKRDAGKWLIMYRVSATFSGCNRAC